VVAVDDDAYTAGLVEHAGMPEPIAKALTTFGVGTRRWYSAVVSDTVVEVAGRPAARAREVLAANRGAFAAGG
jgi:hypothetical protein